MNKTKQEMLIADLQQEIKGLKAENKALRQYADDTKANLRKEIKRLNDIVIKQDEKLRAIQQAYIVFEKSTDTLYRAYNNAYGELDQLIMNR